MSLEGVDSRTEDEDEEPRRRVKELESEAETLKLQIAEGERGRERCFLEMETLRNDALQREVEAKIREVERRAEQNATDTPLADMLSTSSNFSSTASTTQMTLPLNNPRQPEVEEERIHPMLRPPSPTRQRGGSASQQCQQQQSWSPSLRGGYTGYPSREPGSAHGAEIIYNTPFPGPLVDNLQQGWIQTSPWGEGGYADGRPALPYYGYVDPIEQSQHPSLTTTIDARNSGQLPYPYGNAVSNPQQGFPQFLLAEPYPYAEGNPPYPYCPQSPQFLRLDGQGYVGENAYRPSPSNYSPQPSLPRTQQPLAGYPEDDYFVGGFNPYLRYRPR